MRKLTTTARGVVRLKITNHLSGEVTTEVGYNKLTNAFVARLIDGLTTSPTPDDALLKVGVGEGDSDPEMTDTELTNEFIKNLSSIVTTTPGVIATTFTIQTGEANGLVITEFGLFTTGEVLLARYTRSPITKTSDISIEGSWNVEFVTS